jgi:hypothetical protein
MKKFMKSALVFGAVMAGTASYAQIQDEENVTVTMELVPILQLNMNTSDQISFVFDEIGEYYGGIIKYGATILTTSSSVNTDLFASGTSLEHQSTGNKFWDVSTVMGTPTNVAPGSFSQLPLSALELRQFPNDPLNLNDAAAGTHTNYYDEIFAPSTLPVVGQNSVWVDATALAGNPYTPPAAVGDAYLAGGATTTNYINGGSYLTTTEAAGISPYYFVIDYRILPGLPAIFPAAGTNDGAATYEGLDGVAGAYAAPGVYTMNVKYLLIENQ